MIRRIFVEKRSGFDVEAQNLRKELKENLGISGLRKLRIVNRYDIENIKTELFEQAKTLVFSEPNLDDIYEENFEVPAGAFVFGTEYLPGQFDQRADSAETCIRLLNPNAEPVVKCAKIIVIEGDIDANTQKKIIAYCVNPVDSRKASMEKPNTLAQDISEPLPVKIATDFREMDEAALRAMLTEMGFAMNYEDILCVQDYFKTQEFRDPTITELRVIDTYWSDHCRHTTFLSLLTDVDFEGGGLVSLAKEAYADYLKVREEVYGEKAGERAITLMDIATIGAKALKKRGLLTDLDESEEINACSIRAKAEIVDEESGKSKKEDWLVMFKNETHNHPTEIEPFGGAATCLGGAIRDPLSGRSYVYQAMRVTGSGDPKTSVADTPAGKLTQYQITRGAAKGYSSYGNQIGIATGLVDEIYDESYVAKRLEIGAVIGAAPAANVRREAPAKGDAILIVGGRTGRDGIGGATGSSKAHNESSVLTAGAEVQKGNPPVERALQRLFRREEVSTLIKRCNDFGAGGVAVAIGELAPGIDVDLDKVLKKYEGLDGTELAISESQERMAVVVAKKDAAKFIAYAAEENIEAVEAAQVTDAGRFRMYWRGDSILDLSRKFLDTNGVAQKRKALIREEDIRIGKIQHRKPGGVGHADAAEPLPDAKELYDLLSDLNCAGKQGLCEYFDSTIGAGSVLMPFGGIRQKTPAAGMAAKLPVKDGDTNTATLMSYGFDPRVSKESPFHGAIFAVLESLSRIAAMGGDISGVRLSFQEYFPKLGSVPTRWAAPLTALLGALKAQLALGVPAIGGKDSMSGTFKSLDVAPTLVSFAAAVADARHILSPEFKNIGSKIIFLECPRDEKFLPDFEVFKKNMAKVYELAQKGKILAAAPIGAGGFFVTTAKMAFGNGIGAALSAPSRRELLFENYGSLLLEVDAKEDIATLFKGTNARTVGETLAEETIEIKDADGKILLALPLDEIESRYETPLASTFPMEPAKKSAETGEVPIANYEKRGAADKAKSSAPKVGIVKPKVFIPVFPGTNCEADSRRAFERAGAEVLLTNLLTGSTDALESSATEMAKAIKNSQIIMLPGGFSGGDEPEGSAKFIAAVFRNPKVSEAVAELLEKRDGLMLGICNGFQALVKLGLVPYGKITEPNENAPTLTYNTIGRHVSKLVRVRVGSTLSPWLAHAKVGDVHTVPISHGEGRFVASEEVLQNLLENGQIATQYADLSGEPTTDPRHNPNGSVYAIEGITSPDGRIFGRMGHSERNAPGLYVNVPGDFDNGIFESGVRYFK